MGIYQFKLPDIGEGVVEGEVIAWHIEEGASVQEDDPIVDVMTDKANVTIPSPVTGVVTKTVGAAGDIIAVGSVCIEFEVEGEGNAAAPETTAETEGEDEPAAAASEVEAEAEQAASAASAAPASAAKVERIGKPLASPAVRRRAKSEGIDLGAVAGSGPAGRITHDDIEAFLAGGGELAARSGDKASGGRIALSGTTEVPIIGLRRKIAEQMVKSTTSIPHFSFFEEVDVTDLEALRQWLNGNREEGQPKLTYLPFIMQALVKAFGAGHADCNAIHDEERGMLVLHEAANIGIATTTDRGLFVPVVKNVESLDIWQTAAEVARVSSAARDGSASLDDLSGSTFTITSLGRDGGLGATPIINHPEVAILGVHKAEDRAVVRGGKIVIRRMMNFSSSFDHRVVDGANGAALVLALKGMLEHPSSIFM